MIPADGNIAAKLGVAEGAKVILLTRLRYLGDQPEVFVKTYLNYERCASLLSEDFSDDIVEIAVAPRPRKDDDAKFHERGTLL